MRGLKFKAFVIFVIVLGANLFGEDNKLTTNIYDSELIKVNYHAFGGLSLSAKGQTTSISMGISSDFQKLLSSYPDSKEVMESYKSKNTIGNVLLWSGFATAIGGAYYPIIANNGNTSGYSSDQMKIGACFALGGLVVELIGAFILPSSYQDLFNSVNMYNRNKISEYSNISIQ
jgi:hypothetical protein